MIAKRLAKKLNKKFMMGENIFPVRKDEVILDVGSCTGDMTLFYSWKVGDNGRVISIEPEKHNWAQVRNKVKEFGCNNVTVIRKGVYKESGNIPLYISKDASHHSIYKDFDWNVEKDAVIDTVDIYVTTIDSIVVNENLNRVDKIYMNLEGAGYDALLGSMATIRRFYPDIFIATHRVDGSSTYNDIIKLLEQFGYKFIFDGDSIYASLEFKPPPNKLNCNHCNNKINEFENAIFDGECRQCYSIFIGKWFGTIL